MKHFSISVMSILLYSLLYLSCNNTEPVIPGIDITIKEWHTYNTENSGLPHNQIRELAVDKMNNIWVGTFYNGIAKYDGVTWTIYNRSNSGLCSDSIWCINVDKNNNIWIGTWNGLTKFNGSKWTIYNTSNSILPYTDILSLASDKHNILWIGCGHSTAGGILSFDGNKWELYTTKNSPLPCSIINVIHVDEDNTKWIGTGIFRGLGGLVKISGQNKWVVYTKENSGLIYNVVDAIATDLNGDVWIGCKAATYLDYFYYHGSFLRYNGRYWKDYRQNPDGEYNPNAIVSNRVSHIVCDKYGYLWVSTDTEFKFNYNLSIFKDGAWINMSDLIKDYPHPFIRDIKIDQNNTVWLATQLGVMSISYNVNR
jgi:ligand-binding sensor domain-containing protein